VFDGPLNGRRSSLPENCRCCPPVIAKNVLLTATISCVAGRAGNMFSTTTNRQVRKITSAIIGIDASLIVRNNGHRVIAICHPTFLMITVDIIGGPVDLLPILTELY
jgi:hypothetical protein